MVSANWSGTSIEIQDHILCALPPSRLRWKLKSESKGDMVAFPVYLNETRSMKVTEVLVRTPANIPKYIWAQRGVAILLDSH